MRSILVSLVVISALFCAPAFAATAPVDSFKNCSSAGPSTKNCKSRAKRTRDAKAKCEAMVDANEKSTCLQALEDKAAKKASEAVIGADSEGR